MRKGFLPVVASALVAGAVALSGCTVVPIGQEAKYTGEVTFDAKAQSKDLWKKVKDEIPSKAADLGELLTAGDAGSLTKDDVIQKFNGKSLSTSKVAAGSGVVYAVKGTGTVTEVNAKAVDKSASSKGTMTVAVDGYAGSKKVVINVGPVISDTSLRDYLTSINLNDYKDTTQWSQVSQAINDTAQKDVIDKADIGSLKGEKISFTGAFTAKTGMTMVSITPVELSAE